jgi:hypothetical protein
VNLQNGGPAPLGDRPEDQAAAKQLDASILSRATAADTQTACDAYVVLVITPIDKYVRRVYLSLHSATSAIQRATAKGQGARLVLCRLMPVTADLPNTLLPGSLFELGAEEAMWKPT